MTNKYIGNNFDDFLEEEGLLEECTEAAIKKVLAFQIENAMKEKHLSKSAIAKRMGASLSSLNRLLDPEIESATLQTLRKAASFLGKRLSIELL